MELDGDPVNGEEKEDDDGMDDGPVQTKDEGAGFNSALLATFKGTMAATLAQKWALKAKKRKVRSLPTPPHTQHPRVQCLVAAPDHTHGHGPRSRPFATTGAACCRAAAVRRRMGRAFGGRVCRSRDSLQNVADAHCASSRVMAGEDGDEDQGAMGEAQDHHDVGARVSAGDPPSRKARHPIRLSLSRPRMYMQHRTATTDAMPRCHPAALIRLSPSVAMFGVPQYEPPLTSPRQQRR